MIRLSIRSQVSINKRFMLKIRKMLLAMSLYLIPPKVPKIQSRFPSYVAEGTLLITKDYKDLRLILYEHNKYLSRLNFAQNIDVQSYDFLLQLLCMNKYSKLKNFSNYNLL